jgi:hypothetical protein
MKTLLIFVVWWGTDNTPPLAQDEYEIYGQQVSATTGAESGGDTRLSDMGPDGSAAYRARTPGMAYNSTNNEYLVVWDGDDNTPPLVNDEAEIFGLRLRVDFRLSLPIIRK